MARHEAVVDRQLAIGRTASTAHEHGAGAAHGVGRATLSMQVLEESRSTLRSRVLHCNCSAAAGALAIELGVGANRLQRT